jgi:stage II sporulation protein D
VALPFRDRDRVRESRREHLKRLAALVAGAAGVSGWGWGCAAGTGLGGGAAPSPAGRRVRVGLVVGEPTVRIGSRGDVVALEGGRTAIRLGSGDAVEVTAAEEGVVATGGGEAARFGSLEFRGASGLVTVNGIAYRGTVAVTPREGAVVVVNEVGIEEYVAAVIGTEMGNRPRSDAAALAAQAVASRTYTVANLGRFGGLGFDLRAGVTDQGYQGVQVESTAGNRAVADTEGLVLTYGGRAITAFFHSTCGFATASPEESFRNVRPQPYLRSVSDARGGGYYCEGSPHFRWDVEWSGAELTEVLQRTVPQVLGIDAHFVSGIRDIEPRSRGESGRTTEIRVHVAEGEIPVFGPDMRAVFETPNGQPLGSTAVQLTTERAGELVSRLRMAGAGWGHGVGMCQWGAIGRAREGHDYEAILAAYFPGANLERWAG